MKLAILILQLFASIPVFGEVNCEEDKSLRRRMSVEVYGGSYKMPSELFNLGDSDLTKTPPHLTGTTHGVEAMWRISNPWSAGMTAFQTEAVGHGSWERSDTPARLAQSGVTGLASGRTNLKMQGIAALAERRFWKSSKVQPYVKFGGGLGWTEVQFSGEFVGHETMSGFDFPVVEPANDRVVRTIPVVIAEVGLRFQPTKHFNFSMSGYWNTGYGAKLGAGVKF